MIRDILQRINCVQGVKGSFICNMRGEVLSHALPSSIGAEALKNVVTFSLHSVQGLQSAENQERFDFRYEEGRIVIRICSEVMVCLLCTKDVNMPLLNISLNLVAGKLDQLEFPLPIQVEATPPQLPSEEQIGVELPLRLAIANLDNKDVSNSFDSLGMIAISQATVKYISESYKADFKKLALRNQYANTSGVFPVMVIKNMAVSLDSAIIVGPLAEKKLQVIVGDLVEVRIV